MALKKTRVNSTKYDYLILSSLTYTKNSQNCLGNAHLLQFELQTRDTADPSFIEVQQELRYNVPIPDSSNSATDDPLDVTKQNPAQSNIAALAYNWLRTNVSLFADFTDI